MVVSKNKKSASSSTAASVSVASLKNKSSAVSTDETPRNPEIFKSFCEAGKLADAALAFILKEFFDASKFKEGTSVYDVCKAVDEEMERLCCQVENSGISFPCAISPNDLICHYSPTFTDPLLVLKQGDLVKIELGIHVDNCPAFICHSLVIGSSANDTQERLLKAAWTAAQATLEALKPGENLDALTDKFANIPAEFNVNYTQGLMTHVISRNNLAGDKGLIYRPTTEQRKVPSGNVEADEVYLIDVVVSSGQFAVARPTTHRTSIYKKSGNTQALRFKTSRQFISEIGQKYGQMAFTLRNYPGEARARIALKECMGAELVHSYDVIADLDEKASTARFAFTVIVGGEGKQNSILTHPPM